MAPSRNEPTSPVEDSDAAASQDESGSEDSAPASDEEAASDEEGDEGSESGSASGSGGEDEEQSGSEDGESESENDESAAESPVTSKASATKKVTSTKAPADKTGGQAADVTAPRVLVARTPVPGKPNGPRSRPGASTLAPAEATHDTQEGSSTGLSRQHRDASDRGNGTEDDAAVAHRLHHALNPGHTLSSPDVPSDSENPASAATEVEDPAPASSSSPRRALRKKRDFSHLKNRPNPTPEDSSTKDEAPSDGDDTDPESEEEAKRNIQARDHAVSTGRDAQEKRRRGQSTTEPDDDNVPTTSDDRVPPPLPDKTATQETAAEEAKKMARDERARRHISTIGHEVDAQDARAKDKASGARIAEEDETTEDHQETQRRLRNLSSADQDDGSTAARARNGGVHVHTETEQGDPRARTTKPKTTETDGADVDPNAPNPAKKDDDKSGRRGPKPAGGRVPAAGFETHGW